jgi:hypothetical protein
MIEIGIKDIQVEKDMREDLQEGSDADMYSRILHQYHHALWNRGPLLGLEESSSKKGPFKFKHKDWVYTSDSIIHTYKDWHRLKSIQKDEDSVNRVYLQGSKISGYVIFPGKQINRKQTINQRRGIHLSITDRFDLTLECIRRSYKNDFNHPLGETLKVYWSYFEQFGNFESYVRFFFLDDLVEFKQSEIKIKFWLPLKNESFQDNYPLPSDEKEYSQFLSSLEIFVSRRKDRIQQYISIIQK